MCLLLVDIDELCLLEFLDDHWCSLIIIYFDSWWLMLFQFRTIPRSCLTPLQLLIHLAVAGGYFTVPLVTLVFWEIQKWFGLLTMLVLFNVPQRSLLLVYLHMFLWLRLHSLRLLADCCSCFTWLSISPGTWMTCIFSVFSIVGCSFKFLEAARGCSRLLDADLRGLQLLWKFAMLAFLVFSPFVPDDESTPPPPPPPPATGGGGGTPGKIRD